MVPDGVGLLHGTKEKNMHRRGTSSSKGERAQCTSYYSQAGGCDILIRTSVSSAPALCQALYKVLGPQRQHKGHSSWLPGAQAWVCSSNDLGGALRGQ